MFFLTVLFLCDPIMLWVCQCCRGWPQCQNSDTSHKITIVIDSDHCRFTISTEVPKTNVFCCFFPVFYIGIWSVHCLCDLFKIMIFLEKSSSDKILTHIVLAMCRSISESRRKALWQDMKVGGGGIVKNKNVACPIFDPHPIPLGYHFVRVSFNIFSLLNLNYEKIYHTIGVQKMQKEVTSIPQPHITLYT